MCSPFVILHVIPTSKALFTHRTWIWPLPCVGAHVSCELALLYKAPVTLVTLERPFPGVRAQVHIQQRPILHVFTTQGAREQVLLRGILLTFLTFRNLLRVLLPKVPREVLRAIE